MCHSRADVEEDLAPVRALADPIADLVTDKPYTDQQTMLDGMEPKGHDYHLNFQTADEEEERVRPTYGTNHDRLVEVKEKYDPENVFRSNRNIRPRARVGKAGSA